MRQDNDLFVVGLTNPDISAEGWSQQARLGYARAKAQWYQDSVQLFIAMGDGWQSSAIADGN
ncbi:MAG: hypothetical protein ACXWNH_19820 [Vulcanimicrobiaceae bacterium]